MDVLAFPTHREGFGNAPIEAGAAGKPVVAARATGVMDAVIDGVTGILIPIADAKALAAALKLVLEDRTLAAAMGSAGRQRVFREFAQETVWDATVQEYLQAMERTESAVSEYVLPDSNEISTAEVGQPSVRVA